MVKRSVVCGVSVARQLLSLVGKNEWFLSYGKHEMSGVFRGKVAVCKVGVEIFIHVGAGKVRAVVWRMPQITAQRVLAILKGGV